jgi:2,4-dienoyl-CoA reductase-like NADH-dependent reductase (Old Yellow Enzyme family)
VSEYHPLAEEVKIGSLTVPNRAALAAMTNKQSNDDGTLSDEELHWLLRRAEGGFGLVATCAANVLPAGKTWEGELGIYSDVHIPGLSKLASALQSAGSAAVVQIFHGGYRSPSSISGQQPVSCTSFSIDAEGFEQPRELSTTEVEATIQAFVDAAVRARTAGFDGVEIHGAHTYLIAQFLSREYNTRDDRYGRSLENRYRFLSEIIRGVRSACGPDFVVGVRVSPGVPLPHAGMSLAETLKIVPWMVADGVDFIHLSLKEAAGADLNDERSGAAAIPAVRKRIPDTVTLLAAGGIVTSEDVERTIAHGADMVAVARAAIGNARWPEIVSGGGSPALPPYTPEHLTQEGLSARFVEYMRRWPGFVQGGA